MKFQFHVDAKRLWDDGVQYNLIANIKNANVYPANVSASFATRGGTRLQEPVAFYMIFSARGNSEEIFSTRPY